VSSRLNWERANRDRAAARQRHDEVAKRTRPLFKHKLWVIYVKPRPPLAPPKGLSLRRGPKAWIAFYNDREQVERVIKILREHGWHGKAKRTAPDSRTGGRHHRTPAPARNDRPD